MFGSIAMIGLGLFFCYTGLTSAVELKGGIASSPPRKAEPKYVLSNVGRVIFVMIGLGLISLAVYRWGTL